LSFVAFFLLPKLSRLLRVDPTINEHRAEIEDRSELFIKFLSVCQGSEFGGISENRGFVISLAKELENKVLVTLCLDSLGDPLSRESAVGRFDVQFTRGLKLVRNWIFSRCIFIK
jgi:hypothetical protein